jgi:disease resistance protein RPM1
MKILKIIINDLELVTSAPMFPPNITKLTLSHIKCLNDVGMKVIGSLTKLQVLILIGNERSAGTYLVLNCVEDGFPQLKEFQMKTLSVRNWKLANGSMPRLQTLVIDTCYHLDSLPSELWSLTTLRKVHVRKPSNAIARLLQNLEVNNRCELIVE